MKKSKNSNYTNYKNSQKWKKHDHEAIIEYYNSKMFPSYKDIMEKFNISSKGTLHFILKKNPKDYQNYEEL